MHTSISWSPVFWIFTPDGPFIAVFAAYLWGTDYEYGTLRNKLICGHTREEVYFSNLLLTICAGLSTALIWLIVNGDAGYSATGYGKPEPLFGRDGILYFFKPFDGRCTLQRMLSGWQVWPENKNSATLFCLGAVAAMVIIGMLLYDRFAEPELLDGWMWSDTDPTVRWHPKYQIHRWNISYPAGISYLSDTWRTRCNSLRRRGGTPDFSSIVLCVCNFFNISYRKSFL